MGYLMMQRQMYTVCATVHLVTLYTQRVRLRCKYEHLTSHTETGFHVLFL